jgi:hypothetical protein
VPVEKPYVPPPPKALKPNPPALPTLEDCDRKVHYFKTGMRGRKPDCGHRAEYKECNNCHKVVWTHCSECETEKISLRSRAAWGAAKQQKPRNQNQK